MFYKVYRIYLISNIRYFYIRFMLVLKENRDTRKRDYPVLDIFSFHILEGFCWGRKSFPIVCNWVSIHFGKSLEVFRIVIRSSRSWKPFLHLQLHPFLIRPDKEHCRPYTKFGTLAFQIKLSLFGGIYQGQQLGVLPCVTILLASKEINSTRR